MYLQANNLFTGVEKMASVGASFDAAFAGLQKGVEQARRTAAQISEHSEKVDESTKPTSSGDGKGSIIDVTA